MPGSKLVWVYTNQVLCVWFTFTLSELRGYHPGKARWRRVVHVFNLWTHSHSMYTKIHIGYTRLFCRDRHFLPIWCLLPRSLGHKEWYMSVLSMSRRSHKRFVLLFYLAWCIRLFWTNGIILSYFDQCAESDLQGFAIGIFLLRIAHSASCTQLPWFYSSWVPLFRRLSELN